MSPASNATYFDKIRPYMLKHYAQIEQIRESYKGHIGTSLGKASITCDCGKKVSFTTLRFHLCGKKHRRLCGDLPEPPKEEDTEPKTPKPPSSP